MRSGQSPPARRQTDQMDAQMSALPPLLLLLLLLLQLLLQFAEALKGRTRHPPRHCHRMLAMCL